MAQNLSAALINLELFRSQHIGRAGVLTEFSELERLTREALANLREIVYDLRGETTDSGDFPTLLRTGLIDPFTARSGIEVRMAVSPDWPANVPAAVALDLYRIVQEALQNTQKHADAHLVEVNLDLSADGNALSITVADDGRGLPTVGETRPGQGTIGMRERAALLGGELETRINNTRGTAIRVVVPFASDRVRATAG